ncbi:MCE family protein [Nocardia sp. CDC159]|uniref:MCE family protein n=1 Tax=Nocardia pulmonis TaxID=2951408 RepID=A0A9X2IYJ9_9NOCA|nr:MULTISPECIES: MCE family protein [Nocardia]MCM6774011.1 MCE family protein [Nocardia pulmonis]MCM6786898.1 MCE family protein [Nocardia sp. CDC159]
MKHTIRRVIGSAATLLVTTTAVGAWSSVPNPLADTAAVCAEFTDAVGLYAGNSVTVLGVPVGKVTTVEPAGDRVRVHMWVDSDIRLPATVGAATLSDSMLTDRHVELTGTDAAGPALDRSGCIPLDRTQTPKSVSDLYASANKLTAALGDGGDTLGALLSTAAQQVGGQGTAVRDLLARASALIGDPNARDRQLSQLFDKLAGLTTTAAADALLLQRALDETGPAMDTFSTNFRGGVRDIVGTGTEFSPVLGRIHDQYYELLMAVLDIAVPVAHAVVPLARPIGTILDLLPLAQNAPATGAPR